MRTSKTLTEAILSGLQQSSDVPFPMTAEIRANVIEIHVLDFLRQHFQVAYLAVGDEPEVLAAIKVLAQSLGIDKR